MSQFNDQNIAHQYGLALMEEAESLGCVEQVLADLHQLSTILTSDEQVAQFFSSHSIPDTEKTAVLRSQFLPNVSALTGRLLMLLAQTQRVMLVPQIAHAIESNANNKAGIATIKVQSAMPLEADLTNQLANRLQEVLGLTSVHLDVDIQPALMSGLVIEWRDVRLDASLLGQFNQLERSLVGHSI